MLISDYVFDYYIRKTIHIYESFTNVIIEYIKWYKNTYNVIKTYICVCKHKF